jgi:DNA-binding HxlR family transcriptional regulator
MAKNKRPRRELAEEIDLLDTMLSSLVGLLEEKGLITQEEYERRIKQKVRVN